MLLLGMLISSILNSQNVETRCNRVAKRVQHVAPNNVAICCVQMLRSFGRNLQMLGQQCWDMLCRDVAIVWPGLYFRRRSFALIRLVNYRYKTNDTTNDGI